VTRFSWEDSARRVSQRIDALLAQPGSPELPRQTATKQAVNESIPAKSSSSKS
jgi:hypothetical protein